MNANSDFTQEELNHLIKGMPYGYVIDRGGPHGIDTNSPYYSLKKDDNSLDGNTLMVLLNCFGEGMWVRYDIRDIVKDEQKAKEILTRLTSL